MLEVEARVLIASSQQTNPSPEPEVNAQLTTKRTQRRLVWYLVIGHCYTSCSSWLGVLGLDRLEPSCEIESSLNTWNPTTRR